MNLQINNALIFSILFSFLILCMCHCGNKESHKNLPAYKNPNLTIDERVSDLISRMTLKEKISQMVYEAPAIDSLDIPKYN